MTDVLSLEVDVPARRKSSLLSGMVRCSHLHNHSLGELVSRDWFTACLSEGFQCSGAMGERIHIGHVQMS